MNRSAIIVPVALCDAGNTLAVNIGVDPYALKNTLSAPLVSAEGADDAEPTHYGCCGFLTDEQQTALVAAMGQFPGTFWWRWDDSTGTVAASWDDQHLGESWSWEASLAAAGLKRQQLPINLQP